MSEGYRLSRWLVLACVLALLAGCQSQAEQVQSARALLGNDPVVLLSASWCGYCKKLRADFKHWGVHYTEFDVEDGELGERAYHQLHGSGIPITLIGMQRVDGYAPDAIHKLIARAGAAQSPNQASGD